MMWSEFEKIAGYEVSYEDYTNIIEPMYNAVELSKQEFVKTLNRKQFDLKYKKDQEKKKLIRELKELAETMFTQCGRCDTCETLSKLISKAQEYDVKFSQPFTKAEFERAKGYGYCSYIKAIVWYDREWKEVDRLELVA